MRPIRTVVWSLACLVGPISALPARTSPADSLCVGAYFVDDATRLAEVGKASLPLLKGASDDSRCPAAGPAACAESGFRLPAHGKVIVSASMPGFVCATALGDGGRRIRKGWLAAGEIRTLPAASVAPKDWIGTWTGGDLRQLSIKTSAKTGLLQIDGFASDRPVDKGSAETGAFNQGNLAALVAPRGDQVAFAVSGQRSADAGPGIEADDGSMRYTLPFDTKAPSVCRVKLKLLAANYLVLEDNELCGGRNVSFSGPYEKLGT